jgi:ATP synthase protein I
MLGAKPKMDKEATRKMYLQLAYSTSAGIAMVLAIFGCLYIGSYLDSVFDTGPKLTIGFLLVGIFVAFRNLFLMVKKYFPDESPVIANLKNEPRRKRPSPRQD